ncbi:MAG: hypothetical protein ACW9XH_06895 [Candidatus Nitrosopumilus sp. bin_32a]
MDRLQVLHRHGKTIEIIKKFDPKKDYKVSIRPQVFTVLSELEQGKQYRLSELIEKYDGIITKKKNLVSTRQVFKHMMKIGKEIGMIKEVVNHAISFDNFCELDTVSYMRRQLKETKFKNKEAKTKHSAGGTRKSYSTTLWHFNNWLHGKTITISKIIPIGENLQKIETVKIKLDTVEDLLKAFQESSNKGVEVIRMIKEYLMDSQQHSHKSKHYMQNIVYSIKAYFDRNESPIQISFNTAIDHEDVSETFPDSVSTLTLHDLMQILTTGKPSIVEKGTIICKFQGGMDNSTFADRFNFEAFPQLVKWFGSDNHESWDVEKCPVPINITRIKVGFPHICCLDRDAIIGIQNALDWRLKKTDSPMKIGQAIFLNSKLKPITNRWVSEIVTKLAERSGIQKTFEIKSGFKNEKVSHELRDLLKSTLNSCGVASYASNHLIGHMPRDSYEKEAILYPNKIRAEYMKASSTLNIFSGFTKYLNGDTERDVLTKEVEELKNKLDQEKAVNTIEIKSIKEDNAKIMAYIARQENKKA